MAKINLTLPVGELAITGKQITFKAPCDCAVDTVVSLEGVVYALVDTVNRPLPANAFKSGALVTVILNVEDKKAYVQGSPMDYDYLNNTFYSKTQIDQMLGSYVDDIAELLGGEAIE